MIRERPLHRPAVAFHEAGHAVAAHRRGCTLVEVSIKDDGSGLCEHMPRPLPPDIDAVDRRALILHQFLSTVVITLAGPAAQRIAYPRSRIPQSSRTDRAKVDEVLPLLASDKAEKAGLRRHADAEARRTVVGAWAAVERIAAALVEHSTLSGSEATAIIDAVDAEAAAAAAAAAARWKPQVDFQPMTEDEAASFAMQERRQAKTIGRREAATAALNFLLSHPDRYDPAAVAQYAVFHSDGLAHDVTRVEAELRRLMVATPRARYETRM